MLVLQEVEMKRFSWVLLVLLTVGVGLFVAGCSSDRMGNDGARMSSTDLEDMIEGKFKSDPDLRTADLNVDADVDNNAVEISGRVETEALRTKAVDLAKSAHPGLIVTDKIDVTPRELGRSDDMGTGDRDTDLNNQNRDNDMNRRDGSGRPNNPPQR